MDILAIPDNPSIPVPRTRLVAGRWDCGNFLSYATRKQLLYRIPVGLRWPEPAPDIPYLEPITPTPGPENETFHQTWFYFGLIAECLGLNEGPLQDYSATSVAEQQLGAVAEQVTFEEDGQRFISGTKVLEIVKPFLADLSSLRALSRGPPGSDDRASILTRTRHLQACLNLTWKMLQGGILGDIDATIRFSIAALAELISISAHHATTQPRFRALVGAGDSAGVFAFGGCHAYLAPGSETATAMVRDGWCPSEVERLRRTYAGLGTLHYVSRLRRAEGGGRGRQDHGGCDRASCKAFQIDLETYRLAHATPGCTCGEFGVCEPDVRNVLRNTGTFPVLRFERDGERVELVVEECREGMEYVALSHVWADGLGNPFRNSIQQCQVARLMGIVGELEAAQAREHPLLQPGTYRLWIDTLCCPVELSGKLIALERIKDVYARAAHVLVLDSHISSFSHKGKPAAEPVLRVLGTSLWMRRLWTLQEAALSKSLCFHFSDGTARARDLMRQFFVEAMGDVRWLQLFTDASNEFLQLRSFKQTTASLPFRDVHELLHALQAVVYFRTVTVPSDEALCLSTLASLDITNIASRDNRDERMAQFWQEVSERFGGVPARVIFLEDNTLTMAGFRWAPRSLLNADAPSWHDMAGRQFRFKSARPGTGSSLGAPTPDGLRVQFSGSRIETQPLVAGLDLHPWRGLLKQGLEDRVYLKHKETNQWFCVHDWERTQAALVLSEDEMAAWSRKADDPICRAIDAGDAALIHDTTASAHGLAAQQDMHLSLLVSDKDGSAATEPIPHQLRVRKNRLLLFYPVSDAVAFMVDCLRMLAGQIAAEDVTTKLAAISDRQSSEYKAALESVRERMKAAMREFWDATPAFGAAVEKVFGPDMNDYIWATIPKLCSHDVFLTDLSADQVWLVD